MPKKIDRQNVPRTKRGGRGRPGWFDRNRARRWTIDEHTFLWMTAIGDEPQHRNFVLQRPGAPGDGEFRFTDRDTARRLLESAGHLGSIAENKNDPENVGILAALGLRPPPRKRQVVTPVNDAEYNAWSAAATAAGMKLSPFVRAVVNAAIGHEE